MSEFQILYAQDQLITIEDEVNKQMEVFLDRGIRDCLQQRLKDLIGDIDYTYETSIFGLDSEIIPEELIICAMFQRIGQQNQLQQSILLNKIDVIEDELSELKTNFINTEVQGKQNKQRCLQLKRLLALSYEQNIILKSEMYLLNEKFVNNNSQINELRDQIVQEKENNKKKQEQSIEQIYEMKMTIEQLKQQLQQTNKYNYTISNQLRQLEDELFDELQKRNTNLVTFNIQASQIRDKYAETLDFLGKVNYIHQQNRKLLMLIAIIKDNTQAYSFSDIDCSLKLLQSPYDCFEEGFNSNKTITQNLQKYLSFYLQKFEMLIKDIQERKNLMNHSQNLLKQTQVKLKNSQKYSKLLQEKIQKLEQTIHHLTQSNYKVLLDLQLTKNRIESSYQSQCQRVIMLSRELNGLRQQKNSFISKIDNLEISLNQSNQLLAQNKIKIKEYQMNYKSLQECYLKYKENIKVDFLNDKEDTSNMKFIEHLVQKNQQLTKDLSLTKNLLSKVKQDLQIQEENLQSLKKQVIQKTQTAQYAIQTNNVLKIQNERLQQVIKKYQTTLQYLREQTFQKDHSINQQMSQIMILKNINSLQLTQKIDIQIQTDIPDIGQSKVRRQKILNKSIKQQFDRDYCQTVEKEQTKQNNFRQFNKDDHEPKIKIKGNNISKLQCQGSQCHNIQKISALNEIINYMINYMKGYSGMEIRQESWLTHQINKYGAPFEAKVLNQGHLSVKLKNIQIIEELCNKQSACSKLINQFEGIMQYYFDRLLQVSKGPSVMNETISKSKLKMTVNKNMKAQRSKTAYSRIYN